MIFTLGYAVKNNIYFTMSAELRAEVAVLRAGIVEPRFRLTYRQSTILQSNHRP